MLPSPNYIFRDLQEQESVVVPSAARLLFLVFVVMDKFLRRVPATEPKTPDGGDRSANNNERPHKRTRLSEGTSLNKDSVKDSLDDGYEEALETVRGAADSLGGDNGLLDVGFESALPETESDGAFKEYEETSGSQNIQVQSDETPRSGAWVKGRSSIYVDAFNLTLDTVLKDEAHLFDERERYVFDEWKALGYESQYL